MKLATMKTALLQVGGGSNRITFRRSKDVLKGWGKEVHIANLLFEDKQGGYCGKFLWYSKPGAISSMHFHQKKHETFYVLTGRFTFRFIRTEKADHLEKELTAGDIIEIPPLCPHQILCKSAGTIIEFSTTDYADDNYRVSKGDSQK